MQEKSKTGGDAEDCAFARCIERLLLLIEAETASVKRGGVVDLDKFNARKAHALLEFMRLSRGQPQMVTPALAARVANLEQKLAENAQVLQQHMRAISEICDITIKRLQAEESDGTYSSRPVTRR